MNRKQFIGATTTLAAGLLLPTAEVKSAEDFSTACKIPPYLKKGDVIGITSPAGFITLPQIQPAVQLMESWGYKIKVGDAIAKKENTFGGTDAERASDLQSMLDDEKISAIMCARGGYGLVRIIDDLNWAKFKQHPKWVIGFSDATVLHSHIHANCNTATIHSKMTNSFPDNWKDAEAIQIQTILSINSALLGKKMEYAALPHSQNKLGTATGVLIGGNLKTLETLAGTASDINTAEKILFVEDTGEYLYSIDRMFWNLKRTQKLRSLKGLIVGGFKVKPDDEGEEFGKTLQNIVLEKVKEYNYPVCFDFPVGHQRANFALKCGVVHRLFVNENEVTLIEMS